MPAFIEEHPGIGGALLSLFCENLEETRQSIEENYLGCYESLSDYAEELTACTSEVPEHLAFYIDYERMGRDMELSGDVFTVETAFNEIHVFM